MLSPTPAPCNSPPPSLASSSLRRSTSLRGIPVSVAPEQSSMLHRSPSWSGIFVSQAQEQPAGQESTSQTPLPVSPSASCTPVGVSDAHSRKQKGLSVSSERMLQQPVQESLESSPPIVPVPLPESPVSNAQQQQPPASCTPVGVTIAYRQKQKGLSPSSERMLQHPVQDLSQTPPPATSLARRHRSTSSSSSTPVSSSLPRGVTASSSLLSYAAQQAAAASPTPLFQKKKQKRPIPSWQVFLEVTVLYLACLILPNVMGSLYQRWMQLQDSAAAVAQMMKQGVTAAVTSGGAALDALNAHQEEGSTISSFYSYVSASSMLAKSYYDSSQIKSYACSVNPSYYSPTLGSFYAYYLGCAVDEGHDPTPSLFSTDTSPAQDLKLVAILSLCMALVRSLIVAVYVVGGGRRRDGSSNKDYRYSSGTVEAMVRCKSIGLLSLDYAQPLTPSSSRSGSRLLLPEEQQAATTTTSGNSNTTTATALHHEPSSVSHVSGNHRGDDHDYSNSHLGLGLDDSSNHLDDDDLYDLGGWGTGSPVPPTSVAAAAAAAASALTSNTATTTTTIPPTETARNDINGNSASLYAAPRYATALFRLSYSLTASILAFVWFHGASFWPWYVGGSGTTAACWDLSGGLTLGMDSDFDHRNLVLKRYFLLQASYHWQSIAFHILSMVMLIWDFRQQQRGRVHEDPSTATDSAASNKPAGGRRRGYWSVARKTTCSYSRSLLQHLLALLLIAVAYIFSSLRRLGAIGMFAGDVSSCFMHLLQLVLNKSSSQTQTSSSSSSSSAYSRCIPWLYYGGVLPSFVVMRLCIWTRLWYSATVESHSWFQQLERTLFPNSALVLKGILHVWMLLVTYLTVVGLKRLYRHPHLQRSLRRNTLKRDRP